MLLAGHQVTVPHVGRPSSDCPSPSSPTASCPQVVLGTDMKQHFRTVQEFTEKLATSGLTSGPAGGVMSKVPSDSTLVGSAGGGVMPKVPSDSTLLAGAGPRGMVRVPSDIALVPSMEPLQQHPAVGSSKRRNPLRRTNSMQDMKYGARSSAAAATAAIPITRVATAAATAANDDAAHAASSAPHASGNLALRAAAADTNPPLRSAGLAAAATATGSAGRLLPLSKVALTSTTSSASDHVNTGPILPVVTALDDDFCMLLWKASFWGGMAVLSHFSSLCLLCLSRFHPGVRNP